MNPLSGFFNQKRLTLTGEQPLKLIVLMEKRKQALKFKAGLELTTV